MKKLLLVAVAAMTMAASSSGAVIDLPASDAPTGLAPEGIVSGNGNDFYVGSLTTGQIVVGDYRTGDTGYLVTDPAVPVSVGLAFDPSTGYVWAAGGPTGQIAVYDTDTGDTVAVFDLEDGFINDVIVTDDAAYVTNSFAPFVYRIDASAAGPVTTIALSGPAADFVEGFNINGIEATSDGATLILVNSSKGELYTVDAETGSSDLIDLGGESVFTGDGILLRGRTLYVLQNGGAPGVANEIVVIKLSGDLSSGTVLDRISDPAFDTATTLAIKGNRLAVVNAIDFGGSADVTDYQVVVVRRN